MKNIYFPEEDISQNDLYFLCYMIECVARKIHQKNAYVVNTIPKEQWLHLISCAQVLHSQNPLQVESDWITDFNLKGGNFDITDVNPDLCDHIPTPLQMGKLYARFIAHTLQPEENYIDGLIRVYNSPLCDVIDNYNSSAYYEPSYVIERAYAEGGF